MQHPALSAVESVCNDFDGNGIYSVGAIGALRAMSHHWKDHLAEGYDPKIVSDDIEEMTRQLEIMRAEIVRRLPVAAAATAPGVCGKCGSHLVGDYCSDDACPYSEWPQRVPLAELQGVAASVLRKKWEVPFRIRVHARACSRDHHVMAEFDSAPWFAQAAADEIIELANEAWCECEVADSIAEMYQAVPSMAKPLFAYLRDCPQDFMSYVDGEDAIRWLQQHRQDVWARIMCDQHNVRLVEAQEEEIAGMWDWLDNEGNACDHSFDTIGEAALNAVHVLGLSN